MSGVDLVAPLLLLLLLLANELRLERATTTGAASRSNSSERIAVHAAEGPASPGRAVPGSFQMPELLPRSELNRVLDQLSLTRTRPRRLTVAMIIGRLRAAGFTRPRTAADVYELVERSARAGVSVAILAPLASGTVRKGEERLRTRLLSSAIWRDTVGNVSDARARG